MTPTPPAIDREREAFPKRIMELLLDVAKPDGGPHRGPWEDGNGEVLDADARQAVEWIAARAALSTQPQQATAEESSVDGWRPIETAPKDGTKVLLGRFTGRKKADQEGFCAVDRWHRREDGAGFTGFGKFNPTYWPPTHWMPLPPAPSSVLEGGGNADQA